MADDAKDEGKPKGKGGLLVGLIAAIAIGAGAGWGAGTMLLAPPADEASTGEPVEEVVDLATLPRAEAVVALPPVLTTLAGPSDVWVRLELAAVFAAVPDPTVADAIHADALAYLRGLTLPEIASPSGYAFLRADLDARARDLSEGAVTGLLVRGFLME